MDLLRDHKNPLTSYTHPRTPTPSHTHAHRHTPRHSHTHPRTPRPTHLHGSVTTSPLPAQAHFIWSGTKSEAYLDKLFLHRANFAPNREGAVLWPSGQVRALCTESSLNECSLSVPTFSIQIKKETKTLKTNNLNKRMWFYVFCYLLSLFCVCSSFSHVFHTFLVFFVITYNL